MTTKEEILKEIKSLEIDCPDCKHTLGDDQYTCTTCWSEGGNGKLNIYLWLRENNLLAPIPREIPIWKASLNNQRYEIQFHTNCFWVVFNNIPMGWDSTLAQAKDHAYRIAGEQLFWEEPSSEALTKAGK